MKAIPRINVFNAEYKADLTSTERDMVIPDAQKKKKAGEVHQGVQLH